MDDKRLFFFRADGSGVLLNDLYLGGSLFLVAGGPSFGDAERFPKEPLKSPGIVTFGINNSPKIFRPNLWTSVDDPSHFVSSIWFDPLITKFVPLTNNSKKLLDNDSANRNGTLFTPGETWEWHKETVKECPNIFFYKRNDSFNPETYLTESTINWGNSASRGGSRSVLLSAIRIAYVLGFRRMFLLGVDFEMSADSTYSFEQKRLPGSVKGNNSTYKVLKERFDRLQPVFLKKGFRVYNCNEKSALKSFPHVPYLEAIDRVNKEDFKGIDHSTENTSGLYDRGKRLKKTKPSKGKGQITKHKYTLEEKTAAKNNLDAKRRLLDEAKKKAAINPGLKKNVSAARIAFRAAEDEKRWKHGQSLRWKRWTPDKGL